MVNKAISITIEFETMNIPFGAGPLPQVLAEELKKVNPKIKQSENTTTITLMNFGYLFLAIFNENNIIIPIGIIIENGKEAI